MKLVILFGPQAVGKMTVGHELEKSTGLKLFHNHMTIELIVPLFGYGQKAPVGKKLVKEFRTRIFEEFAKTDNEGLIFTYIWAFDLKEDGDYLEDISKIFESKGAKVYRVELVADIDVRIERNKTAHRLKHKPTKNNIERSENELKESMKKHRLTSNLGEIQKENYLRINNSNLEANEVAKIIIESFGL